VTRQERKEQISNLIICVCVCVCVCRILISKVSCITVKKIKFLREGKKLFFNLTENYITDIISGEKNILT